MDSGATLLPIFQSRKIYTRASQNDVVVGPRWKEYMQELSERSFNQFDTMIVGEAAGIDFARACEITQEGAGLLDAALPL